MTTEQLADLEQQALEAFQRNLPQLYGPAAGAVGRLPGGPAEPQEKEMTLGPVTN